MHKRQAIRKFVAAAIDAAPQYEGRVHVTRLVPIAQDALPAVCIYGVDEQSGLDGSAHGLERQYSLQIDIVMAANDGLDDAADDHAEAIEKLIAADRRMGGLCYDVVLVATRMAPNRDGEFKTFHCVLQYAVTYRTARNDPAMTDPN